MNTLNPELKRVIAAARQAATDPIPAVPLGLATRVLAEARPAAPEEGISSRLLGGIFLSSAAVAVVWVMVVMNNTPVGSDQIFKELAAQMVMGVGR